MSYCPHTRIGPGRVCLSCNEAVPTEDAQLLKEFIKDFTCEKCSGVNLKPVYESHVKALNAKIKIATATFRYIVEREDLTFAECSDAEDIWSRCKAALVALESKYAE